jgi:hypothetical protein
LLDPKSVTSLTGINGVRAEIDDRFICARWRKQKFVEGVMESTKGAAMSGIVENPFVVFAAFLVAQWIAAYLGDFVRSRRRPAKQDELADLDVVQTAALTSLALIIGFTFSMAVSRYDQRKDYEEAEANAIGTEYLRADLLPAESAPAVRNLIRQWLYQRVVFYQRKSERHVGQIEAEAEKLQAELWSAILPAARDYPTPVTALAVAGMNDMLNAQSRTQGAWWNRIPAAAWGLMGFIAIACNGLLGYSERRRGALLLLVVPIIMSISVLLIADIDSPRGGIIIRVHPNNLIALSQSIKAQ